MWGCFASELSEVLICYAQKAGFLYSATQSVQDTLLQSRYYGDSGLVILSRFPIAKFSYHKFSYGLGEDNEVKRGAVYA